MLQKINWSAISPDESEKLKKRIGRSMGGLRSKHPPFSDRKRNIRFFKPLVRNKYIPVVELYTIRNGQNRIDCIYGG